MSLKKRICGLVGLFVVFAVTAFGQANCQGATATTNIIRGEGTTEQVAPVTFSCSAFGGAATAGSVSVQVFLSPALPVTSKVVNSGTGATEATLQLSKNGTVISTVQGTISGATIIFSAVPVPALSSGESYTFTILNVRVNATALAIGTGIPPLISETIFISGTAGSVVPSALGAAQAAFVQNGLSTSIVSKVFTTGNNGWPSGTGSTLGANNFQVCNAYSPSADGINLTSAGSVSGSSLAFVVGVRENFAQAFGSAASEAPQVPVASGTGNAVAVGTRFRVTFSDIPANVALFVPNGSMTTNSGGAAVARLTSAAANAAFVSVPGSSSTSIVNGTGLSISPNSLSPVSISAGVGSAVFEITTGDPNNLDRFDIPVYVVMSANTVPFSATPMHVAVSFASVGTTAIPNFVVSTSTTTLTGSTFNGCNVSQSITFAAPPNTTVGAALTLSATATSSLPVSFTSNTLAVCTVSGSAVTLLAGGSCSITASQAGDGTYGAATAVTQTFTVAPADQTINFTQPGNATFGSGAVQLTATASSGLGVTFASTIPSVCTVSGASVTLVSVGNCAITASQAGNANYAPATPITRTFSILAPANLITLTLGNGGGATGRTVELPVTLGAMGTAASAGFQLDLNFDTTKLSYVSARIGEQSTAAVKGLSSSTLPNGQVRLLVSGFNQNTIAAGPVAYASFQLTAGFTSGTTAISGGNCAATDITGGSLFTSCVAGSIRYATCDINADGNTNVSDVQLVINQALGVLSPTHDLNSDGSVNVADVQIVINAALGLGCNAH